MININRLYNDMLNKYRYRSHSEEVKRFVKDMYPTLAAKSISGPLFDNKNHLDDSKRKDLIYLVTFCKKCPENQIHLKVKKSSKEVSEVERFY